MYYDKWSIIFNMWKKIASGGKSTLSIDKLWYILKAFASIFLNSTSVVFIILITSRLEFRATLKN